MWRTAKADVAGELGIPPQTSQMSQLSFGAIGVAHAPGDNVCYCLPGWSLAWRCSQWLRLGCLSDHLAQG